MRMQARRALAIILRDARFDEASADRHPQMKGDLMKKTTLLLVTLVAVPCLAQKPGEKESGYPVIGAAVTSASEVQQTARLPESKLELASSDNRLVEAFDRAKRQAMGFVFEGDPVGPWYEAAEPGREAFCMRDTAHQAMGAHALGLARHNLNMLRRFAEAISDSKDWCSYWEIDRYNRPAPVDYASDAEFWYNLPANFDILDCCYRMYVWTGDPAYVNDAAFLNFYDRTVSDYVERWGLGLKDIMRRPRLLNLRGMVDPNKKFQTARGIPGYNEGDNSYVLGFDVLANQYDAYIAYARIQEVRKDYELAGAYLKRAVDLKQFLDTNWWNKEENCYYARLNKDHKVEGRGPSRLPYDYEGYGGDQDALYTRMLERALPGRSRWDYPEVPFAWIGDFVTRIMGINLEAAPAGLSAQQGFWVATVVKTQPGLGSQNVWTELRNLPIRANEVTVRHEGMRRTVLTNQHGPAVIWQATFEGAHDTLLLNGRPMEAHSGEDASGRVNSSLRVTISGGGTASVEVAGPEK